jgi:hypothetical protein
MALTLESGLRDLMVNALGDAVDVGVTEAGGKLVIETVADAEISLHRFADPAFDTAPATATGIITLQSTPIDDTSAVAGTADQFSIYNRNDLKILEGGVAVTGEDLDLSSLVVGGGDTVSLTSFTITMPA